MKSNVFLLFGNENTVSNIILVRSICYELVIIYKWLYLPASICTVLKKYAYIHFIYGRFDIIIQLTFPMVSRLKASSNIL